MHIAQYATLHTIAIAVCNVHTSRVGDLAINNDNLAVVAIVEQPHIASREDGQKAPDIHPRTPEPSDITPMEASAANTIVDNPHLYAPRHPLGKHRKHLLEECSALNAKELYVERVLGTAHILEHSGKTLVAIVENFHSVAQSKGCVRVVVHKVYEAVGTLGEVGALGKSTHWLRHLALRKPLP